MVKLPLVSLQPPHSGYPSRNTNAYVRLFPMVAMFVAKWPLEISRLVGHAFYLATAPPALAPS